MTPRRAALRVLPRILLRILALILLGPAAPHAPRAAAETSIGGSLTLAAAARFPRNIPALAPRDLGIRGQARLSGAWYPRNPRNPFSLIWDLAAEADNAGRPGTSNHAPFSTELNQFLLTLDLPMNLNPDSSPALRIEAGRAPFTVGEALLRTPSNLPDPSGSLEDARSFWRIGLSFTPGIWSLAFDWIPALGPRTEPKWRGFTNPNPSGLLTLGSSWFIYPLNIHLRAYLADRLPAPRDHHIGAGAATLTWNILPALILKGEFLAAFRGGLPNPGITTLGALVWSPVPHLDLNTEDLFNSRPLTPVSPLQSPPDPLDRGRHFLFLLARLTLFDSTLTIQTGLLTALEHLSLSPSWNISFAPGAAITIFCRGSILTGPPDSLFARAPTILAASAGVTYAF